MNSSQIPCWSWLQAIAESVALGPKEGLGIVHRLVEVFIRTAVIAPAHLASCSLRTVETNALSLQFAHEQRVGGLYFSKPQCRQGCQIAALRQPFNECTSSARAKRKTSRRDQVMRDVAGETLRCREKPICGSGQLEFKALRRV